MKYSDDKSSSGAAAVAPAPAAPTLASNAQAIIEHTQLLGGVQVNLFDTDAGAKPFAVLPSGKRLESLKPLLDQYAAAPDRITGTATLHDEASFIEHVQQQQRPSSRIFFDRTAKPATFTVVYDYHSVKRDSLAPAFRQHRAVWPIALSEEWKAWSGKNGNGMSMADFSAFLEQHVGDIYWGDEMSDYTKALIATMQLRLASPTKLVELARNLAVNVDTQVRQAITLQTGEISLTYTEQHRDGEGQPITVPNAFLIRIPIVLGGPLYQFLARLRYRVQQQRITWSFELHRVDLTFETAMAEIRDRVQNETGLTVFAGTPET